MDWRKLHQRAIELPDLEINLAKLNEKIAILQPKVDNLQRDYERNKGAVDKLISGAGASSFLRFFGHWYDSKLDKRQRQETDSRQAYEKAVKELGGFKTEQDQLYKEVLVLRSDKAKVKKEITRRRNKLEVINKIGGDTEYSEILKEYADIEAKRVKVRDAANTATRAYNAAKVTENLLKKSRGWATYHMFAKRGIVSHTSKYNRIDDAHAAYNNLAHHLSKLRNELKDVHGENLPHLIGMNQFSSCQRMVDFWFDNIFTTSSVRRRVSDNLEKIRNIRPYIKKISNILEAQLDEVAKAHRKNKLRKEEFLLGLEL